MSWNEIYQRNKKLDDIFMSYLNDKTIIDKNCLELTVEIAEFANETRCFKYWSTKKMNKEAALEELADSIMTCLFFYNYLNIEDIETQIILNDNILVCLNEAFKLSTQLFDNIVPTIPTQIFNYLIHIGKLLEFKEEEIIEACFKKIVKQENRLKEGY